MLAHIKGSIQRHTALTSAQLTLNLLNPSAVCAAKCKGETRCVAADRAASTTPCNALRLINNAHIKYEGMYAA